MWICYDVDQHRYVYYFDLFIFVYLGLLQFVGLILAFQTRKVKIYALNDSKPIAALIYISSIALVVIVLISFILRGSINISAAVFFGGIILLATTFLALIFVPKVSLTDHQHFLLQSLIMFSSCLCVLQYDSCEGSHLSTPQMVSLYRDPEGDSIFSDGDPSNETGRYDTRESHHSQATEMSELTDKEKVVLFRRHMERLQENVSSLQEIVREKNRKIAELKSIIKSTPTER